jgi:hypothetical protein
VVSGELQGCVSQAVEKTPAVRQPYGYLRITCRGGVNQQRQQICDAVALAAYLQTHLVLPVMAKNEFWKDDSRFEQIFDVPVSGVGSAPPWNGKAQQRRGFPPSRRSRAVSAHEALPRQALALQDERQCTP